MLVYIIVLALLGALIAIDGIKAYRIYKTSTVTNRKPLLVIHYVLLFLLTFFIVNSVFSVFQLSLPR